jgi:hypothetical protein
VIVRIQGEGQYELADDARQRLDELDSKLFQAVESGNAEHFASSLRSVVSYVEGSGSPVPDDRLVASDIILPASDTSLDEVKRLLTDEGYLKPVEA